MTEEFSELFPLKENGLERDVKATMPGKKPAEGGAEDGDFVALRARRQVVLAERLDDQEESVDVEGWDWLSSHSPSAASPRSPALARHKKKRKTKRKKYHWERVEEGAEDWKADDQLVARPASREDQNRPMSGRTRTAASRLFDEAATASRDDFEKLLNETSRLDVLHPTSGQTILLHVLDVGRLDLARLLMARCDVKLLCQDCDVTVASLKGKKNALHYVTELKDVELARQILEKIRDVNQKKALLMQETPIQIEGQRPRTLPCCHLASFLGCTELVVVYLSSGVTVNAVNSKKDTALLWAARWNHLSTVQELLSRNADANIENDKGSTALYWAVRYGHTDTVRLLITVGKADVTKTRKLGLVSPIILACALGYLPIVRLLVEGGANPNECIRGKERPVHHGAREGYADIVEYLLQKKALIDDKDEAGDTALLYAVRYGHSRCVQLLLSEGADHTVKNHKGEDLMSLAVDSDNRQILKMVLQFVKIHGEVKGSRSPLLLAAGRGHMDKIQTLLAMGLHPDTVDDEGNGMMHYAAMENQAGIIEGFYKQAKVDLKNTAGNTALHEACARGHGESILALINCKATASIRNDKGETALHLTAYCRAIHPEVVKKLMDYVIKSHAWESLNIKDSEGNNALHVAAKFARPEVMWEFRHVPFKIKDADGNIALHEAVRPGEPDALVTMLDIYETMKRDADINEQNNQGQTVLHLAAKEGFKEHVARLILLGVDLSKQDNDGNTVFHLLVQLSADHPQKASTYLAVFQTLLEQAAVWWCIREQLHFPHGDDTALHSYTRQSSLLLLTKTYNKTDSSVLALACQVGASDILRYVLSKHNVMCYRKDDYVTYNVTNMTPLTNNSFTGCCSRSSVVHRPSYIEFLTSLNNSEAACKVLDVQPFSEIEKAYSSVAAWTYAVIMIIHIIYMSLFSYSGIRLLEKRRADPDDDSMDAATGFLFVLGPVEPGVILIYNLYRLARVVCTGELPAAVRFRRLWRASVISNVLYLALPVVVSLIYSVLVLVWIVLYAVHNSDMDYVFSVAVCIGWLYTISFTRGFRIIHYFWRMIQNMIVKDILKFLFIYLFVLLAFSFAFHATFQISQSVVDEYPSPFDTAFLVFNLMIGMGELFTDTFESSMSAVGRDTVFVKVLYLVYMVLGTILLLNLLIAMMNDSYAAILNQQSVFWRMESVQLGVDIEKAFPATTKIFSSIKFEKLRKTAHSKGKNPPIAFEMGGDEEVWYISIPAWDVKADVVLADQMEREVLRDIRMKVDSLDQRLSSDLQQLKHDLDDLRSLLKDRHDAHKD